MSTSGTDKTAKISLAYIASAAFTALFGAVYESFSHGVYSYYMIYAFAWPLLMGALPYAVLAVAGRTSSGPVAENLWHSAVATLTVGSAVKGVLEIYGTTNRLSGVYGPAGLALAAAAVAVAVISARKAKAAKGKTAG